MRLSRAFPILAFATIVLPGVAEAATTKCRIPNPCALFQNSGKGPASESDASAGPGVLGTTSSGNVADPGVEGESENPDGSDAAGAFGLNVIFGGTEPAYGVVAYGSASGTYGQTDSAGTSPAEGIEGYDNGGAPGSDLNSGVLGYSKYGTGVIGESNGAPSDVTFGSYQIGGYFVGDAPPVQTGFFTHYFGIGVVGESSGIGLKADNNTTGDTVDLSTSGLIGGGYYLDAFSSNANAGSAYIDDSGNEGLSGFLSASTVFTTKGTYVRSRSASGRPKLAYGARTTTPQIEDIGEGQLANGRAHVPFDATLADVIDRRHAYHVFLTPEGDCNGLYVTGKTSSGFDVRELRGGTSSLAFEYRIVAKPLGEDGVRLAAAPEERRPPGAPKRNFKRTTVPRAETPLQRLERMLGPAGAARAIAAAEAERRARY